jgi:hypothetical protein
MSGLKSSWPEVVGLTIDDARQKILNDRPDVQVVVVPPATPTKEFNNKRVIVFVNSAGIVMMIPVTA